MPRNPNLKKILIPGSGPIIIGQACEFDYSGVQACKALRDDGYECVLINSNPATIMTDPKLADHTYIEPLTVDYVKRIIEIEKPDAILTTVGGQTALNLSLQLAENDFLSKRHIQLLGANAEIIRRAENRQVFKLLMQQIGLHTPESRNCQTKKQAQEFLRQYGLPLVIRTNFTLGGTGGGLVRTAEEFARQVDRGLQASLNHEIIVEKSILGWYEFELELMRDYRDNVIVVCSIENLDPMGIHTGDSITVCPQQTLSDRQYQEMRNAALKIIRAIGVETGGCNIQFAIHPETGKLMVVEMNPRVSRSSALASKATGFPIARVAALLAVGYSLDEIQNTITKNASCSFEPAIDYIVTKIPYFTFRKFPGSPTRLGTAMRSVGEAMSMGRNFKESLQKGIRSLENQRYGVGSDGDYAELMMHRLLSRCIREQTLAKIASNFYQQISFGYSERIFDLKLLLQFGLTHPETKDAFCLPVIAKHSQIHPWFLGQLLELAQLEKDWLAAGTPLSRDWLLCLKQNGFCDHQLAFLILRSQIFAHLKTIAIPPLSQFTECFGQDGNKNFHVLLSRQDLLAQNHVDQIIREKIPMIQDTRNRLQVHPVYKTVDTCAGEFASYTPYHYSTYDTENEIQPDSMQKKKVIIIGAGPNRIGQGIEFDYCCCHAAIALREIGYQAIMMNSNPETVSTDYDSADKLIFDPIQTEEVLELCRQEKPDGLILSFGGQGPLRLLPALVKHGHSVLGLSPEIVSTCEDREKCAELLYKLQIKQPSGVLVHSLDEAREKLTSLKFPLLVRPSFVLGGQDMSIVYEVSQYMEKIKQLFYFRDNEESPVLVDHFLENAIELDVDAISDGQEVYMGGIMQHVEQAGIHSGDSSIFFPAWNISEAVCKEIESITQKISLAISLRGPINIQFALQGEEIYVIEINPRASRTLPFVSKTLGISLSQIATKVMCGYNLSTLNLPVPQANPNYFAAKAPTFPFARFPGSPIRFGPEMKSTGESMGIALGRGVAYLKALIGAGEKIPSAGSGILITVNDLNKPAMVGLAKQLSALHYVIYATQGTSAYLVEKGVSCTRLYKKHEGLSPNTLEAIGHDQKVQCIINIFETELEYLDASRIREFCLEKKVLCITTVAAAQAFVMGLEEQGTKNEPNVISLQRLHQDRVLEQES